MGPGSRGGGTSHWAQRRTKPPPLQLAAATRTHDAGRQGGCLPPSLACMQYDGIELPDSCRGRGCCHRPAAGLTPPGLPQRCSPRPPAVSAATLTSLVHFQEGLGGLHPAGRRVVLALQLDVHICELGKRLPRLRPCSTRRRVSLGLLRCRGALLSPHIRKCSLGAVQSWPGGARGYRAPVRPRRAAHMLWLACTGWPPSRRGRPPPHTCCRRSQSSSASCLPGPHTAAPWPQSPPSRGGCGAPGGWPWPRCGRGAVISRR